MVQPFVQDRGILLYACGPEARISEDRINLVCHDNFSLYHIIAENLKRKKNLKESRKLKPKESLKFQKNNLNNFFLITAHVFNAC